MRPIPPVLAPQRLRRLPRRQQELVEAAAVLGERRGLSVYLVGGPVRDLMLGSPGADLDITVVGNAVPYAKALAASLGARVTIHPRFGTATLILQDGLRLDVATARRERYRHPAALPQVFPATIDEDLFRRDFTINAMAVRLASGGGELLDPFGGLKDLKERRLRALHDESYRDDPTRILRGARYAARYRLRFSVRDRRCIESALAERVLQRLSGDRLFREVKLLLHEAAPEAVLKILEGLGVLRALDPAMARDLRAVAQMRRVRQGWQHYRHLGVSPQPELWRVYLLILLRSVPARARRRVGRRLGLKGPPLAAPMGELRGLPLLQRQLEGRRLGASRLRHLLDRASPESRLLLWAGSRKVRRRVERYLTRLAFVKPALTGRDLKEFGFVPGPTYRQIMDMLLRGRLDGHLKSREEEIALLRQRFGRPH
ncbi:MAG: CCA tRNA nucleotidyltransferase [Candidatus Methylomirabilales bacterium]